MFYEKLAQAKQEKKKRNFIELSKGQTAALAAGGIGGTALGHKGITGERVKKFFQNRAHDSFSQSNYAAHVLSDRQIQAARDAGDSKLVDRLRSKLYKEYDEIEDTYRDALDAAARKGRLASTIGMTGLGIAGGYAGKKLYDRFNRRKKQEG